MTESSHSVMRSMTYDYWEPRDAGFACMPRGRASKTLCPRRSLGTSETSGFLLPDGSFLAVDPPGGRVKAREAEPGNEGTSGPCLVGPAGNRIYFFQ